ncbi:tether containing UBX domain for GLUT4 isoform X2 [Denticeps clupeoides]|uniref:UBX domain-containing protein n=1 Tax=Denticeps clupeoides TaxID=299321 RepID=A0AAY4EF53_9TELE|nr:tether containing UBX domain for GLUT4 isoform X2 [Denticeps clupeoides]
MAASSIAVSVLVPNGRRQTVKVSPNTPLLQVLEDVCKKHGFNPDEHGLRFQRNVLDLALQWRFASLPNNAKLEVVPSTRQRTGTESLVRIALQLEDGSRLQGSFSSGQSLWELLNHFEATRPSEEPGSTPLCVYMRDEISGVDALKKTTLKSLGLTGGSAIVRYVLKKTNVEPMEAVAADNGAMVSTLPPPQPELPPQTLEMADESPPPPVHMETAPHSDANITIRPDDIMTRQEAESTAKTQQEQPIPAENETQAKPKKEVEPELDGEQPGTSRECQAHTRSSMPSSFVPFSGGGQRLGGQGASVSSSPSASLTGGPPKAKRPKPSCEAKSSTTAKCGDGQKVENEGEEFLEPVDRDPLVYHLDSGGRRQCEGEELPDEFFEVTVDDIRKRFAQLKSERKVLEEGPLMTKALRECQIRQKMERYPKVVLRVQFPDRHILQGFFRPLETVSTLRLFVKTHLADPHLSFYLFIAPPRTILGDQSATLFQANLFPAALVYFGSDVQTDCYLRSELLDSSVSALQADEHIAGCMPKSPAPSSASLLLDDVSIPLPAEISAAGSQQGAATDGEESHDQEPKAIRTDPGKVPKWLKLPGKK